MGRFRRVPVGSLETLQHRSIELWTNCAFRHCEQHPKAKSKLKEEEVERGGLYYRLWWGNATQKKPRAWCTSCGPLWVEVVVEEERFRLLSPVEGPTVDPVPGARLPAARLTHRRYFL